MLQRSKTWASLNVERRLRNRIRWELKQYGLTPEKYAAMLQEQQGKCAVCRVKPEGRLRVDHNHKTGVVRGLLCHPCNAALGLMQDSPDRLRLAVTYLERRPR